MNTETLREDISYLRKLAESGRRGPIMGGAFLAGAGVVFGLAAIVSWAADRGFIALNGTGYAVLWIGAFVVFALYWLVMFWRLRRGPKVAGNASTAVFGTIWGCCGAGVMVVWLANIIVVSITKAPVVFNGYLPVIFAFYGTAWFISAVLAKRGWMAWAGGASYLFAFAMALLTQNSYQSLVMGLALLVLLTVPGIKLATDEAKS